MGKNAVEPEACVAVLCQDGCARGNRCISLLREDLPVPAPLHLTDGQYARVLRVPEAIMAVYSQRCGNR